MSAFGSVLVAPHGPAWVVYQQEDVFSERQLFLRVRPKCRQAGIGQLQPESAPPCLPQGGVRGPISERLALQIRRRRRREGGAAIRRRVVEGRNPTGSPGMVRETARDRYLTAE